MQASWLRQGFRQVAVGSTAQEMIGATGAEQVEGGRVMPL